MTARCELTELDITGCAHCKGIPNSSPDTGRWLGHWFPAMYDGRCSECGEVFRVLDRIRAEGKGGYLGECCGEAP